MTQQLQFGLIGAGRIGRVHAESLSRYIRSAELVAVADVRREAAELVASDFGIARVAASPQQILDDAAIDAVLICSSTDTHAELISAAAQAGKHIFCEKPIALELDNIDRALAAVDEAGVKLQIGFNRRFDANFRRLRQAVQAGEIGTPHLLRITSRDPAPPPLDYIRVSGGLFLDMAIHDFDMARFLLGDEVEEVYAVGAALVDPAIGEAGDIDTAVITLRFRGGAIGVIDNSRQAVYGYDQRAEVFGSAGAIDTANRTPDDTVLHTVQGISSAKPLYFFLERYLLSYVAEMWAFVDAIEHDSTPTVTGRDGRMPVVMGLAAQRSLRERRPVRLDEIDPHVYQPNGQSP